MAYLRSVTAVLGAAAALVDGAADATLAALTVGAAGAVAAALGLSSLAGALLHAASPNQTTDSAKFLTPSVYSWGKWESFPEALAVAAKGRMPQERTS